MRYVSESEMSVLQDEAASRGPCVVLKYWRNEGLWCGRVEDEVFSFWCIRI